MPCTNGASRSKPLVTAAIARNAIVVAIVAGISARLTRSSSAASRTTIATIAPIASASIRHTVGEYGPSSLSDGMPRATIRQIGAAISSAPEIHSSARGRTNRTIAGHTR